MSTQTKIILDILIILFYTKYNIRLHLIIRNYIQNIYNLGPKNNRKELRNNQTNLFIRNIHPILNEIHIDFIQMLLRMAARSFIYFNVFN